MNFSMTLLLVIAGLLVLFIVIPASIYVSSKCFYDGKHKSMKDFLTHKNDEGGNDDG